MSIPRDELDQQIVEEESQAQELNPAELAPDADMPDNDDGVEVAASGSVGRLGSKIGRTLFQEFDNRADVIRKPDNAPEEGSDLDRIRREAVGSILEAEQGQNLDEMPLASVEGRDVFVRPATADEMQTLQQFADDPNVNMDIVLPNLSKIALADGDADELTSAAEIELKKLITATYETYKETVTKDGQKILRKGNRGFEQIVNDANRISAHEIFLQLMKRKPGERPFTDSEMLAARRTVLSLQVNAMELMKKARQTGDVMDKLRAAQAISLEGYASIQLVGIGEDMGRSLAAQKIIASPSRARVGSMRTMLETASGSKAGPSAIIDADNLDQFLEAYGGESGLDAFLVFYDRLPADGSRHQFARRSVTRRGADMLVEIYQSALLSNVLTHSFNAAGTVVMMETLMFERLLEGRPKEAFAMLAAQAKYMPQALRAGWYALKHERSLTDNTTRLEVDMRAVSRQGAGLRNKAEGGGNIESAAAMFFDASGVMLRAQGFRPMLAMDEVFKGLSRGMQMEALAIRAQEDAFRAAIQNGQTKDQAKGLARDAYIRALKSESVFEEASEFARVTTFQDDLPGAFAQAQGLMSHPLVKIWVPFYKTPTQVMRRITERTPLAIAMPSVLRDKLIRGTNNDRREAMARIAFGTGVGATLMHLGTGGESDDFVMTGYGPTDPKQRSTWLQNNRPYSIGIRQDNGTFEWIGYERYDPMSGVIAMAMDTAFVLEHSDSVQMADDAVLNLGIATTRYVTTALPMTQFIGEIIDVAGSPFETGQAKADRIRSLLAKQAASAGLVVGQSIGTMGMGTNSMLAQVERYMDPYARDTKPESRYDYVPGIGLQPEMRGVYEALQYMRSRTPGLSADLPIKRNRWFEPVLQGNPTLEDGRMRGNIWQTFVPYKVQKLPGANMINKELERLGLGFPALPQSMNEPMIKLSGKQYERYVELYNYPERSEFAKDFFSVDFGGEVPRPAVNAFAIRIQSKEYSEQYDFHFQEYYPRTPKQKMEDLRGVDAEYKQWAKKLMLLEFPELQALTTQRDAYERIRGRNPAMLFEPTPAEVQAAGERNRRLMEGMQ